MLQTKNDPNLRPPALRAPTGTARTAKSWLTEAPLRMLMNNLDPRVAENPEELVVYGGIGKAARTWEDFDAIVGALRDLESDETLLVQSGRPVGVFRTHADAPRTLVPPAPHQPRHARTMRTRACVASKRTSIRVRMSSGSRRPGRKRLVCTVRQARYWIVKKLAFDAAHA